MMCGACAVQGKDLETIDLKRTGRSATAGLCIHGPLCHFWIELMQTYLVSGKLVLRALPLFVCVCVCVCAGEQT